METKDIYLTLGGLVGLGLLMYLVAGKVPRVEKGVQGVGIEVS